MKKTLAKPNPGDRVEVIANENENEGVYLESSDPGIVLLKLDSGYNVGLKKEDISEIRIVEKVEKVDSSEDGEMK